MLSNTGCASAIDSLTTRSTSAEVVCSSSASLVSLNSRTFSIAITAWSAKVCSSSTCLSANAPGRGAGHRDRADHPAVAQHRHASTLR